MQKCDGTDPVPSIKRKRDEVGRRKTEGKKRGAGEGEHISRNAQATLIFRRLTGLS